MNRTAPSRFINKKHRRAGGMAGPSAYREKLLQPHGRAAPVQAPALPRACFSVRPGVIPLLPAAPLAEEGKGRWKQGPGEEAGAGFFVCARHRTEQGGKRAFVPRFGKGRSAKCLGEGAPPSVQSPVFPQAPGKAGGLLSWGHRGGRLRKNPSASLLPPDSACFGFPFEGGAGWARHLLCSGIENRREKERGTKYAAKRPGDHQSRCH